MANKLFGTDGIRGVANERLTAQLVFNLGQAFALLLEKNAKHKKVIVGRDTRVSGQMLCSAFVAGLNSMGFSAVLPNILPTPALAYLTKTLEVDGGVMITASHNPAEHNGLKTLLFLHIPLRSKVTNLSFGRQKSKALLSTISFMAEELSSRARFIRWKRRFVTFTETKPKKRRSLKRAFFPVIFLRSG